MTENCALCGKKIGLFAQHPLLFGQQAEQLCGDCFDRLYALSPAQRAQVLLREGTPKRPDALRAEAEQHAEAWEKTKEAADFAVQGVECEGCAYKKACPVCPAQRLQDLQCGHCNPAVCKITRQLVADGVKKLNVRENENLEHGE